ncbi:MAG: hypothetical protein ACI85F_001847 [Bacteroidia bacterium]|jgi:hypothetical protein
MRDSLLLAFLLPLSAFSQSINVEPYLQDAEPTSIRIMWETTSEDESTVQWGLTNALGTSSSGSAITGSVFSRIHDTQLTNLTPNTVYHYRVKTGSAISPIYDFKTPALQSDEAPLNIIAMSDMQQDIGNQGVFQDVINNGVIPFVENRYGANLSESLGYVVIPGDLIDNDLIYSNWENTFFDYAKDLFSHVPVYPVAGNHEYLSLSPAYTKYFHLPDNGSTGNGNEEHWWYKDNSNVRLIGLESNGGYANQTQLDWLQPVLDNACADADIDFVFAEIHHPFHSEMWPPGENDYTGDVITMLEAFSTDCGKPSAHFFGHTHAYSRGQSKEHNHLMVNVATAGGNIDYWGEYDQIDYPEFNISDDSYGFVLMEVEAGNDPKFKLTRVSTGDADLALNNVIIDSVTVKFNNPLPAQPIGIFPPQGSTVSPECLLFQGTPFSDPQGDLHGATQWQIATDQNFSSLMYDEWYQHNNYWNGVDILSGHSLTEEEITILDPNSTYYWRLRYRDRSLGWSEWCQTVEFSTSASSLTSNLLLNGDAENGTTNWVEDAGSFESIASGDCGGINAYSGSRLFAVGGVCDNNSYAEGHQDIDVTAYSSEIVSGGISAHYGGRLSNYDGDDHPEFKLEFYDEFGTMITITPKTGTYADNWPLIQETAELPTNTATIRLILSGTRNVGFDNDCYFDELFVKLSLINGCQESLPVSTAGLTYTEDSEINVYPNPFAISTTIEIKNAEGMHQLQVFNPIGSMILSAQSENGKFQINRSELSQGMYIYRVLNQNGVIGTGKFVTE